MKQYTIIVTKRYEVFVDAETEDEAIEYAEEHAEELCNGLADYGEAIVVDEYELSPAPETITGFFLDPENGIAEPRTIEKTLDSYHSLLRCDSVDIFSYSVDGENFDIICDQNATALRPNRRPSAFDCDGLQVLDGPLFFVRFASYDDVTDLTPEGMRVLEDSIAYFGENSPALVGLEEEVER